MAAHLLRFAVEAARHFDTWEVIDYASASKPDAPSGTARELAERLDEVRRPTLAVEPGAVHGHPEARGATIAGTQVHSVRLPGFVVSTEIVDIMKAAGLASPDISILSDEFLAEIRDTEKKNLAIEALRKLINGEIHSQSRRNVTQSKGFTERLEAAVIRYHNNAITTAQVLEELIKLAKDIRAARARGEEAGLSDEEIAFYDALAANSSARELMGEPALRVIAHELVTVIKGNVTVDWMHRDSARANIRRHVKRLLRKYGYPPDLQDAAVQNVLQQAEALSGEWAATA